MTDTEQKDFHETLQMFIRRNFPQIQMHGGDSSIMTANKDEGIVEISLTGACSGCGISPMTVEAIKRRMFEEFPSVDEVKVYTGQGMTEPINTQTTTDQPEDTDIEAPF